MQGEERVHNHSKRIRLTKKERKGKNEKEEKERKKKEKERKKGGQVKQRKDNVREGTKLGTDLLIIAIVACLARTVKFQ